ISAIMGPCAGGAVYSPAMTDFILMVDGTSYMFITGPDVIKAVTHEEVTKDALGGAHTHASRSGVAHFAVADEPAALSTIREPIPFIPQKKREDPPARPTKAPAAREEPKLDSRAPRESQNPYNIKDIIHAVVDDGHFLEVQAERALNIVGGFARLDGRPVG